MRVSIAGASLRLGFINSTFNIHNGGQLIATNRFFISMALGIALGAIGLVTVGYLATLTIPAQVTIWLDQHNSLTIARIVTAFSMQLIGFGVFAALLGQTLGKTKHWLSNSLVSYFSMVAYVTILDTGNMFNGISIESTMFSVVPLASLLISAYLSHKKYNNKLSSALDLTSARSKKG